MSPAFEPWPVAWSAAAFAISAAVLVVVGVHFTRLVDRLADRTGLGEALAGAVLLGATTSLPGLVVTVWSAAQGQSDLAVSNALGGIAAQTVFLALADLRYGRANLEHAAASIPNLLQTLLLIALIGLVAMAALGPQVAVLGVHPITLLLPLCYLYGLLLSRRAGREPMWWPHQTPETRADRPEPEALEASLVRLWLGFAVLAAVVGGCGFVVARAGVSLVAETGLSGSLVGGLVTSVVTSLPELVTVMAAVRRNALQLAVGDIVGGNSFDVLFVAAADVAYREGSIYAAVGRDTLFLLALTVLLTALLAAGLVYREKRGIGFEGLAILGVYAVGMTVLSLAS